MNKELLEQGVDVQDTPEKNNYQRYVELGGIINEKDYESALIRARNTTTIPDKITIGQAEGIAKKAGIELHSTEDVIDQRIILYGIMEDIRPEKVMDSDWRLFREALRILEDTDALNKLKAACHTNRTPGTYCPLCGQTKVSEDCP